MGPRIRTATLTGYAALVRSLNLDPAELIAAVGLAPADLDAGDRWIPAAPVARLLELSAQRSGVEDFALRLGTSRSRLSTYMSGKVTPSAALMLRMRRVTAHAKTEDARKPPDSD